jgi:hypothetical protein
LLVDPKLLREVSLGVVVAVVALVVLAKVGLMRLPPFPRWISISLTVAGLLLTVASVVLQRYH